MVETKEIHLKFRVDEVVPEPNRTKLFFIIHQSMLDGSLDWGRPIKIVNHSKPVDPYSDNESFMHVTKIHNQLSEHLDKINKKYDVSNNFEEYYLIKLNGLTNHSMIIHGCLIYLPQTNQAFRYADDWNADILLSHEYVFVIN
jgi:hypothetical protein